MAYVYCRPHVSTITPENRFVVRTHRGIDLGGGRVIKEGEEFPADAVSEYILRCLYGQLKIDLMPQEGESAASQPTDTSKASQSAVPSSESSIYLDSLSRRELSDMCEKRGLSPQGSKQELRDRLAAVAV